jgi:hypothetical protein
VKRHLFAVTIFSLCGVIAIHADENIAKAQDRLKAEGFYLGKRSGIYDSDTAAAVTRFQIRNGLSISGKLDAETARALGVSSVSAQAKPKTLSGTWRRLRDGTMQFVSDGSPQLATSSRKPSPASTPSAAAPPLQESAVPPSEKTAPPHPGGQTDPDRLRDYVAAFILAGIDPHVGSELEFFASQVDYFGAANVSRERIRRDLLRYDRQWPDRRFWLDGDIEVQPQGDDGVKVVFPLRYELRNGSKRASGKVSKSLTLHRGSDNQFEIIGVNEQKG